MRRALLAALLAASWAAASPAQDLGTTPPPASHPKDASSSRDSAATNAQASAGSDASAGSSSKKSTTPFYRKYLVPGNPLDDQIVEQEKRIVATPSDPNLHNDFGNLLAKRHFPKEAAEQYEIAAKLDKSNFISYYNLGLLRESEGKIGDAISAYQHSIKRKPGFPPSRFRLGRLYEREGRYEEAISQYSQSFLTDPSMRDPKRNPLVIDSELIYRASLANYQRDVSMAVETGDVQWFDDRFKSVPVDRAVSAEEVEPAEASDAAPREVGPAGAAGAEGGHPRRPRPPVAGEGGGMVGGPQQRTAPARPTRMNRPGSRPAPAPAPPPAQAPEVVPPPEETPAQPEPSQDPNAPETMPDQPQQPPDEVEPS